MSRKPLRRRKPAVSGPAEIIELTAAKLGSEGVGVGYHAGKPVLLPGILPEERVRAEIRAGAEAKVIERLNDSADRIVPSCQHFGACGGCALQHLRDEAYRHFKRQLIVDALRRHGLSEITVGEPVVSPPGTRRRASLEAIRRGDRLILGFHARASHEIVDLQACPVLVPALVGLIAPLRKLLLACLKSGERATIVMTMLETGTDLGLDLPRAPDLGRLEALADFAAAQDLARLWWRTGDIPVTPAAINRPPEVRFGDIAAELPTGGFLQATKEGQAALIALVTEALAGAKRIADLYAGAGTFSLPLAAAGAKIHAVESDAAALAALAGAARRARFGDLTVERRDLDANPLLAAELSRFDAVVFDPPRAGARAQAIELAKSDLKTAVAVSCNPDSFARDAAILLSGGWQLDLVTPVDQFLWSPHLELVAVFRHG